MKFEFYLPTKENWCGTFDGGYVQVYITNNKQPINFTKRGCDWANHIFIIFQGTDDYMMAKRYKIDDADVNKETVKALELISNIPLPVTKEYLETIGFEVE